MREAAFARIKSFAFDRVGQDRITVTVVRQAKPARSSPCKTGAGITVTAHLSAGSSAHRATAWKACAASLNVITLAGSTPIGA
jgi:hypothetical protein